MKKILLSLGIIAVTSALIVGATGAFFSDTETSVGNTFTAGAIDLKVDSEQHYNGNVCVASAADGHYVWAVGASGVAAEYPVVGSACGGTWALTDLGAHTFFNFDDIKPGDFGENTISIHVINNDAWMKMNIGTTTDSDNTQTEPESSVDTNGLATGELGSNMKFRAWIDDGATDGWQGKDRDLGEGDNIWKDGEAFIINSHGGPADGWMTLAQLKAVLATKVWSVNALETFYIGMEWTLPASEGNITQTDSLSFPVEFMVVQKRNNPLAAF